MTILIGGAPTGLLDSSQTLLGRNDQTSTASTDNGDQMFVNVAKGNLLYSHQDVYLPSFGDDYSLVRTYNSRGATASGGAFNDARWRNSTNVAVIAPTDGETSYRVRYGDNSVFTYALDAATGKYISTNGTGAYETLEVLRDGAGAVTGYTVLRADQTKLGFGPLGRLLRVEDANGVFQKYTYGTFGVEQIEDDQGHVLTYGYNVDGRLTSVTDETNAVLVSYTYSGGRLASVTDRMGHVTRYFYDLEGSLQRIELPDQQSVGGVLQSYATRVITFEYLTLTGTGVPPEGTRVLTRITDAEGKSTLFSYAFEVQNGVRTGWGKTTVTDASGKTMNFSYRADGAITQVTDQSGCLTSYVYDAAGNLLSVTDRNGYGVLNSDSSYYRALRAELGYTDAAGAGRLVADLAETEKTALQALFTARFSYDARGNVLTSTDNAGNTTTFTYTAFNKVATVTRPNGDITQFFYDAKQNLIKQADPGGDVTGYTYDGVGNVRTRVVYLDRADAAKAPADVAADKKQETRFFYDLYGNNVQITDAEGVSTYSSYDHFGNPTSSTDGRGNQTLYTYDADNRLVQLQDPTGRKTLYAYDAVGNRIVITTGWNEHTITQVFDRNNRLVSTIDTALDANASRTRTTTVGYDNVGNRTSVTDAEGRTTTYTYNARRELVEIKTAAVDHDGNAATAEVQYTRTLAYDFEGNRITETDNRNNPTSYQYTRDGLLRLQTTADGQLTQYSYDRNQNLLSVVAGLQLELSKRQTTTYAYDAENQRVSVTDAKGNITSYIYDAPGNVVAIEDANHHIRNLAYDRNNRLRFEVSAAVGVFDPVTGAAVIDAVTRLQQTVSYTVEHRFDGNGNEIETIDQNGKSTGYAFDTANRVSSVTDANGIVSSFSYNGDDKITRVEIRGPGATEPASVTTYVYDEFTLLVAETDGVGNALVSSDASMYQNLRKELGYTVISGAVTRAKLVTELNDAERTALLAAFTTHYTYDKVGNRKTEVDNLGRTTSFDYDSLDRLVRSTDAMGGTQQYRYDGNGNLLSETDELGRVTTYTYDSTGRVETRSDPFGTGSASTVTRSVYDSFGNVISRTEAFGTADARTTSYAYDANNRLTALITPGDRRTSYEYDAVGNRTTVTDARQNSTGYTYDALNRVVTVRDPLGRETRVEYDGVGNRIAMIDARNTRTRMEFDPGNRMTTVTDGEQRITRYSYDALGNTITVTTAAGTSDEASTRYEYDAAKNLRAVVDAANKRSTYRFDRVYNQTSVTDARGNTTITAFDALDRAVLITDPTNGTTRYTYDATGNVLSVKDANGNFTRYAYDRANRVITETDALGGQTAYAHDAFGATTTITRAANRLDDTSVQSVQFSTSGQRIAELSPEGYLTTFVYDASGNEIERLEYDDRYTLASSGSMPTPSAGDTPRVTVSRYDTLNRMTSQTDARGLTTWFEYDEAGNLTHTLLSKGSPPSAGSSGLALADATKTTRSSSTYDKNNRVVTSTDAGSVVTRLTLDAKGRITQRIEAAGTPSARTTAYTYDALDRVTTETSPLGRLISYTYDEAGNVLTRTTSQAVGYTGPAVESRVETFSYDSNGRLAWEDNGVGTRTAYQYDAAGNRKKITYAEIRVGTGVPVLWPERYSVSYEYDANNRLTAMVDGENVRTEYAYDARGNKTSTVQAKGTAAERTTTYVYDDQDRLISITNPENKTSTYYYDAQGNQVCIVDAAGGITYNTFNEDGRILTNTVGAGTVTDVAAGSTPAAGSLLVTRAGKSFTVSFSSARGGVRTINTYGPRGNVLSTSVGYADGTDTRSTSYTYNLLNQMTSIMDGEGFTTEFTYDAFGNQTSITTGLYKTAVGAAGYDARKALRADPQSTRFYYDRADNLIETIDGQGNKVVNTYDCLGNRTSMRVGLKNTDASRGAVSTDAERVSGADYAYDRTGALIRTTSLAGGVEGIVRDVLGRVKEEQTLQSGAGLSGVWSVVRFGYDRANRVTTETDAENVVTNRTYDAFGNILTETRAFGTADARTVTYAYDRMGRLVQKTDAMDFVTAYAYDARGNMTKITDAEGGITRFWYDEHNRLQWQLSAGGSLTGFTRDSAGNITETRSYYKRVTGSPSETAPFLLPTNAADANDRIETQQFNADNKRISKTAADGSRASYTYDSCGMLIEQVDSASTDTQYLARTEDLKNRRLTWEWDASGRLTTFTNVDGVTETYTYDSANNKLSAIIKDPNLLATGGYDADRVTLFTYDNANRLVSESIGGFVQALGYDKAGNVVAKTAGDISRATSTTYDKNNRVKTVTDALGGRITYTYDSVGNLVQVNDALNAIRTNTYDRNNRLLTETGPATETYALGRGTATTQGAIRNSYDKLGNLISRTDERDFVTLNWYDNDGRLVATLDGDNVLRTLVVNAFGEAEQVVIYRDRVRLPQRLQAGLRPSSADIASAFGIPESEVSTLRITTTTKFDLMGRAWETVFPPVEVATIGAALSSDSPPAITTSTVALVETSRFDAWGNLIQSVAADGGITTAWYDLRGRQIMLVDAAGFLVATGFDSQDHLVKQIKYTTAITATLSPTTKPTAPAEVGPGSQQASAIVERFYDQRGNVIREISPAVSTSSGSTRPETRYVFDAANNLVSKTLGDGTAEPQTEYYYYDVLNRLSAVVDNNRVLSTFDYDLNGNLIAQARYSTRVPESQSLPGATPAALLSSVGGSASPSEKRSYAYNALNKLVTETDLMGEGVADDLQVEYRYGPSGNRTSIKKFDPSTGEFDWTRVEFDAKGRVIRTISPTGTAAFQEYNVRGQVVRSYMEDAGYPLPYPSNLDIAGYSSGIAANVSWTYPASQTSGDLRSWIVWGATSQLESFNVESMLNPGDKGSYASATPAGTATSGSIPINTLPDGSTFYFRVMVMNLQTGKLSWSRELKCSKTRNPNLQVTVTVLARLGVPRKQARYFIETEYNDMGMKTASNEEEGLWREFAVDRLGNAVVTTLRGLDRTNASPITSYARFDKLGRKTEELGPFAAVLGGGAKGALTVWGYDYAGRECSIRDPGNLASQARLFVRDGAGNLVSETDALGAITVHSYDRLGNRIQTIDGEGHTRVFVYAYSGGNANRLISSYFLGLESTTTESYGYDAFGRRTGTAKGSSRVGVWSDSLTLYFLNHGLSEGQAVIFGASSSGTLPANLVAGTTYYVVRVADKDRFSLALTPGGAALSLGAAYPTATLTVTPTSSASTYDQRGRMVTSTDGEGNTTQYRCDHRDNQIVIKDANGNFFGRDYDKQGRVIAEYSFDKLPATWPAVTANTKTSATTVLTLTRTGHGFKTGQLISFSTAGTLPAGLVAGKAYYIKTVTTNTFTISASPDGSEISFGANGQGSGIFLVCSAIVQQTRYDTYGNKSTVTDAEGRTQCFEYGPFGRLLSVSVPLVLGNDFYTSSQIVPVTENATASGVNGLLELNCSKTTTASITDAAQPGFGGFLSWNVSSHGLTEGQKVTFSVSSGGTLPTGIVAGRTYYVANIFNSSDGRYDSFRISETPGGALLTSASVGSGTFSVRPVFDVGQELFFRSLGGTPDSGVGTLPTGLVAGQSYFVKSVSATGTFTLSATVGGAAIPFSSAGTGGVDVFLGSQKRLVNTASGSVPVETITVYGYDKFGRRVSETGPAHYDGNIPATGKKTVIRGKDIKTAYDNAGRVIRIDDTGYHSAITRMLQGRNESYTEYRYDVAGNRVYERFNYKSWDRGWLLERAVNYSYYANGVLKSWTHFPSVKAGTQDISISAEYFYYKDGNLKQITQTSAAGKKVTTYEYDAANRLTKLKNDDAWKATQDTTDDITFNFSYDYAGNRFKEEVTESGYVRFYSYNKNGAVTFTRLFKSKPPSSVADGSWNQYPTLTGAQAAAQGYGTGYSTLWQISQSLWVYDKAGNITQREHFYWGPGLKYQTNTWYQWDTETNSYDASYRVYKTVKCTQSHTVQTTETTADRSGRVSQTRITTDGSITTYGYFYDFYGKNRATSVAAPTGSATASYIYDSNGRLLVNSRGSSDPLEFGRDISYSYDNEGHLLLRYETRPDNGTAGYITVKRYFYLYALGNPVGDYADQQGPYVGNFIIDGTVNIATGVVGAVAETAKMLLTSGLRTPDLDGDGRPLQSANGDYAVEHNTIGTGLNFDPAFPDGPSISQHTVQAGDTLESIAGQYYGSPELWFAIAEANGLGGTSALKAGSRLVIPVTAQDAYRTSRTHALYNESTLIGSKLPAIPQPAPDPCAKVKLAFAIILIVVVAIAAALLTVVSAGALAPVAAAGTALTAGAVIGAVVATTVVAAAIAFAASAITQGILVGFELQKEFDWKAVAADVVAGAIGGIAAGIGQAVAVAGKATSLLKLANVVAQTALEVAGEAANQAIQNDGRIVNPNMLAVAFGGGLLGALGDVVGSAKAVAGEADEVALKAKKIAGKVDDLTELSDDLSSSVRRASGSSAGIDDVISSDSVMASDGGFQNALDVAFGADILPTGGIADDVRKPLSRSAKAVDSLERGLGKVFDPLERLGKAAANEGSGKAVRYGALVVDNLDSVFNFGINFAPGVQRQDQGQFSASAGRGNSSSGRRKRLGLDAISTTGLGLAVLGKSAPALNSVFTPRSSDRLKEVGAVAGLSAAALAVIPLGFLALPIVAVAAAAASITVRSDEDIRRGFTGLYQANSFSSEKNYQPKPTFVPVDTTYADRHNSQRSYVPLDWRAAAASTVKQVYGASSGGGGAVPLADLIRSSRMISGEVWGFSKESVVAFVERSVGGVGG